jgi:polyribonucleotide nucleotidyltransferase
MVEGGAKHVAEAVLLEALRFGHREIRSLIEAQEKLVAKAGKTKRVPPKSLRDAELERKIEELALDRIRAASQNRVKKERYKAFDAIDAEVIAKFVTPFREAKRELSTLARSNASHGTQARAR